MRKPHKLKAAIAHKDSSVSNNFFVWFGSGVGGGECGDKWLILGRKSTGYYPLVKVYLSSTGGFTAIYSGQAFMKVAHIKVACYSCWSEPVKLKIVSLTRMVQRHFINTLAAGFPGDMRLSACISLACWQGSQW